MAVSNADIYGLGYVSSPPAMSSSWMLTSDTETRDGDTLGTNLGADLPVKLVDDAVTAGTTMTVGSTTVVTGSMLVDFLNDLYTEHGAVAGDYVVFRVNPDADEFTASGASANFRYAGSQRTDRAQLSLTIVPEVSTALLSSFAACGLLLRRRRA